MDEKAIQDRLRQNIPTPDVQTQAPVQVSEPVDNGNDAVASTIDLDDMTQYKLHDFFGVQYRPRDEESKQRVQFIYEQITNMLPEKDYGSVVSRIRELERMIGSTNEEGRIYRLYQWLKLDKVRRQTELEMGALSLG